MRASLNILKRGQSARGKEVVSNIKVNFCTGTVDRCNILGGGITFFPGSKEIYGELQFCQTAAHSCRNTLMPNMGKESRHPSSRLFHNTSSPNSSFSAAKHRGGAW